MDLQRLNRRMNNLDAFRILTLEEAQELWNEGRQMTPKEHPVIVYKECGTLFTKAKGMNPKVWGSNYIFSNGGENFDGLGEAGFNILKDL